jgi:hypothetical protein
MAEKRTGFAFKIAHKIPLYISVTAMLVAGAVGAMSFVASETELKQAAENRLIAVLEGRRAALAIICLRSNKTFG